MRDGDAFIVIALLLIAVVLLAIFVVAADIRDEMRSRPLCAAPVSAPTQAIPGDGDDA